MKRMKKTRKEKETSTTPEVRASNPLHGRTGRCAADGLGDEAVNTQEELGPDISYSLRNSP